MVSFDCFKNFIWFERRSSETSKNNINGINCFFHKEIKTRKGKPIKGIYYKGRKELHIFGINYYSEEELYEYFQNVMENI